MCRCTRRFLAEHPLPLANRTRRYRRAAPVLRIPRLCSGAARRVFLRYALPAPLESPGFAVRGEPVRRGERPPDPRHFPGSPLPRWPGGTFSLCFLQRAESPGRALRGAPARRAEDSPDLPHFPALPLRARACALRGSFASRSASTSARPSQACHFLRPRRECTRSALTELSASCDLLASILNVLAAREDRWNTEISAAAA